LIFSNTVHSILRG